MIHRKEENSQNTLFISGRIVSKIEFLKRVEIEGDNEIEYDSCEFVIKNVVNGVNNLFRVYTIDPLIIKHIKKNAVMGTRIYMECRLNSRRRVHKQVNKLGLDLYSIDLIIVKLNNLVDTVYDIYNKDERKKVRKAIQEDVFRNSYPGLRDFDNYY